MNSNELGIGGSVMEELRKALEPPAGQSTCNLESLMREYGNDVLRTAYLYVKDIHTAEDIFQDVFLKVNLKLDTFQGNSSIKTWLIRITINTCKDFLKSAWNTKVLPMEEETERTLGREEDFDEIERRETKQRVKEAVEELPVKYREVILCVYFHEMSVPETAKVLRLAEGTVKSRLSRGREKLKKMLEGRV